MTNTAPIRLLIVGAPGAGKGTQATGLAEAYGVPAISTGDIFRENIKNGTELGKRVQEITAQGQLVPDSLTNDLISDRLSQADVAPGFLLDGYPRTVGQVEFLTSVLEQDGAAIDAVVQLVTDTDAVVERLLKRAQEQGRVDDTEEIIRHRQEVYLQETAPVIDVYASRGVVVEVDGMGTVEEVATRILDALKAKGLEPRN
ncbi:adenylate kinase [Gulosibacter chungangensis]|uniref:Adenylate kinase n=1 Tax=Gulosibacter chungangensis TaxID=979746 RepID=A0A7J5B7I3_9MICO|nr:adenylate kinase [Gulosibacter chungangensis]KAB1640957.1 adenylate kinase [Gulosibacter chungangensis]